MKKSEKICLQFIKHVQMWGKKGRIKLLEIEPSTQQQLTVAEASGC